MLSCTTSRLHACLRTERQDKATPAVLMANTFYANAVRSRCCSAGKIATKQCRCAAFQERLPCSHCPMHVLHAAVAGACEEQEEYLRESRHVCAPERSQTRPHTDTEHPTQPGVVDGVTGRPPRHVQRALGQHAFCPRKWHQTRAHQIDMPSRARLNPRAFTSGRRRRRAWPRRSAAAPSASAPSETLPWAWDHRRELSRYLTVGVQ